MVMKKVQCGHLCLHHSSQVALLIDGENGPASSAEAVMVRASEWGDVTLRRVYGDWSSPQMRSWREVVTHHGMRAVHQHLPKKNAADIALAVDAVDLFHQGFRRFCLVSGDSDYVPLVLWLMEHGCLVAVIGPKDVSRALQQACSVFVSSEQLRSPDRKDTSSAQEAKNTVSTRGRASPANQQTRSRQRGRKKRVRRPSPPLFPPTEEKP